MVCANHNNLPLTGGDVEAGDDILRDTVKVLHQRPEGVAVGRDLQ